MKKSPSKTLLLLLSAFFAALIATGAFLRIQIGVVPFTMQVFFVLLSGMLLGSRYGTSSVLVYLFLGLIGIPVFTDGGGIGYLLNPKFGYLVGFVPAAALIGKLSEAPASSYLRRLTAGFLGIAAIYLIGVSYYWLISFVYLGNALSFPFLLWYCFLLTLPGDLLSCLLAAAIAGRIRKAVRFL